MERDVGGGYYNIITHNGKCFDVPAGNTGDYVGINQFQCDGSIEQKFSFDIISAATQAPSRPSAPIYNAVPAPRPPAPIYNAVPAQRPTAPIYNPAPRLSAPNYNAAPPMRQPAPIYNAAPGQFGDTGSSRWGAGFELFWDGKKVNGPETEFFSIQQAQQSCDANYRTGIIVECRFNGSTFRRWTP